MMRQSSILLFIAGLLLGAAATAQSDSDAHPGYWKNLFENTIRYSFPYGQPWQRDVAVYFNADHTVTTDSDYRGRWHVEGAKGEERFCYAMSKADDETARLSECFALRLMYNPRIGAQWVSAFKEGVPYHAIVVQGR